MNMIMSSEPILSLRAACGSRVERVEVITSIQRRRRRRRRALSRRQAVADTLGVARSSLAEQAGKHLIGSQATGMARTCASDNEVLPVIQRQKEITPRASPLDKQSTRPPEAAGLAA